MPKSITPRVCSVHLNRLLVLTWGGIVVVLLFLPEPAHATVLGILPIERLLQKLMEALQGPIVFFASTISVILFGLALAFGGGQGLSRQAIGMLFGISIAVAGASFVTQFFEFSQAAAF